jgi:hypothetical protein
MTLIEIRSHRWDWKVFESPGVEPVSPQKRLAIDYAETRACFRMGEIRVLKSNDAVERIIAFNETGRKTVTRDVQASSMTSRVCVLMKS